MRSAQIRFNEIMNTYRRRWKLVVIPTVIVSILCAIGAYLLPRKYEATTVMLIRPDQTLGTMRDFDGGGFVEQLRSYGEIIYSRTFIQTVIDSLGMGTGLQTEADRQGLINNVKRLIATDTRGSDAFSISFTNSSPELAKRGAEVAANLFIETKVRIENRQNLLTVEFLERKVDELRGELENSTRSLVSSMHQDADELPIESKSLYAQVSEIETSVNSTDLRTRAYQKSLVNLRALPELLRSNPEALRSETGKQPLLELQQEDLPYVAELRSLVSKYDESTQRYTGKWPEIEKLEGQIVAVLDRIRARTENEISKLQSHRTDLERRRERIIEEIKKSSLSSRMNQDKQSTYEINLRQYNEMKGRLEQARLKAEVESKGANQYIILDPPIYPAFPTKPNRKLLVLGGFGLGLFLGLISVIVAELFDTTIRSSKDMAVYEKPVIALLPDGTGEYR